MEQAKDRLLAIASLVNGYHNGDQSDAPGVLRAIADALGPPFERSPKPPPSVTMGDWHAVEALIEQAAASLPDLFARDILTFRERELGRALVPLCLAQGRAEGMVHASHEYHARTLELQAAESALASLTAERDQLHTELKTRYENAKAEYHKTWSEAEDKAESDYDEGRMDAYGTALALIEGAALQRGTP